MFVNRAKLEMETKRFCENCGAPLPSDAIFCSTCGAKASVEVKDDEAISSMSPRNLRSLMFFVWLAVGLNFFACLIGFSDVSEYYTVGRFGLFLFDVGYLAIAAWLAFRLSEGLNWARVTFVADSALSCFVGALGASGNKFAYYVSLIAVVVNLICAGVMLFERSVSSCFRKIRNGVKCACVYWCVNIGFVVFFCIYGGIYQGLNERSYFDDCVAAAREGSEEARSDLLAYFIENSNVSGSSEEIVRAAEQRVKALERNPIKTKGTHKTSGEKKFWTYLRALIGAVLLVYWLCQEYKEWMREGATDEKGGTSCP